MKRIIFFLLVVVIAHILNAQGVAVNTDGSAPHASAMLDVKSITGGLLAPRMTSAQRIAISTPTAGLMVYDTDMKEFYHHDGSVWRKLLNSNYWQRSSSGNHVYSIGDSVGISTSNPKEKFHVNSGNIYLQDNRDGATLNPHLIFDIPAVDYKEGGLHWKRQGDTLASLDYLANPILSNYLKFTVGKGSSMYLNSSGLGLGSADPQAKLHIRQPDGDDVIRLDAVNPEIEFRKKSSSTITSWTPVGFLQTTDDDDLRVGTYSSNTNGKFVIRTGGNDRVFVNSEGYVGIGTDIPAAKLQVHGGTGEQLRIFAAEDPILQFADGFAFNQVKKGFVQLSGDNLRVGTNSGNDNGKFIIRTNNSDRVFVDNSGRVGINQANPTSQLHVSGRTYINNGGSESLALDGTNPFIQFYQSGSAKSFIQQTGSTLFMGVNNGNLRLDAAQIAIGQDLNTATGYKLAISGKVICEELKVSLVANWPDYVFQNNYKRLPLSELKKFIDDNMHLPNIPSAKEIENNKGFELGEMQRKMMEKIEELALYVIELQEQIDVLKKLQK